MVTLIVTEAGKAPRMVTVAAGMVKGMTAALTARGMRVNVAGIG